MNSEAWRTDWHKIMNTEAHALTGSAACPGVVYPYDIQQLPTQLQKLPGLYAGFVSGYLTQSISPEGVTVLGEVVAARADEGIGKGYVWVFGLSGSGVYFNGPYKPYDGHHFPDTGSVPVEKLFGNVPEYPRDDKPDA